MRKPRQIIDTSGPWYSVGIVFDPEVMRKLCAEFSVSGLQASVEGSSASGYHIICPKSEIESAQEILSREVIYQQNKGNTRDEIYSAPSKYCELH